MFNFEIIWESRKQFETKTLKKVLCSIFFNMGKYSYIQKFVVKQTNLKKSTGRNVRNIYIYIYYIAIKTNLEFFRNHLSLDIYLINQIIALQKSISIQKYMHVS